MKLDLTARYKVANHGGVAWYINGFEKLRDEDYEWTGIEITNQDRVECIMVGDDQVFTFDVTDLTPLTDEEYCPECGQIGCKAYQ